MFTTVRAAIRNYIITRLAELVADDIINNGLTADDMANIDAAIDARQSVS
jgi:hypothetical protein